ncbi:hypothetical protein [Algoriphagus marinus]|uniref:hypothetical protein n=1 Tax=Algoriphagus marinus TaxID=1925762 RepID=UPI001115270F|nr:hypothetical protein [Algoriphagus marinus]
MASFSHSHPESCTVRCLGNDSTTAVVDTKNYPTRPSWEIRVSSAPPQTISQPFPTQLFLLPQEGEFATST